MFDRREAGVPEPTLEVLLTQHEQLREGIRTHARRRARRTIGGLSAAGLVAGYALAERGDPRALALLPFVFGFLFFVQVASSSWILRLASEICRIQRRVGVAGFSFESRYGILSAGPSSRARLVSLGSVYALLLLAYLASALAGVAVTGPEAAGLPPAFAWIPAWLGPTYALLLVLMLGAFLAHLHEIRSFRRALWSPEADDAGDRQVRLADYADESAADRPADAGGR